MHDVACRAGVSITTVSHVLHGTRFVSPLTANRVWQAVEATGFAPRQKSARRVKRPVLGLILSDVLDPLFPGIVEGFERAAARMKHEVSLAHLDGQPERALLSVERMIETGIDGIALMTADLQSQPIHSFRRHRVPVVCLNIASADAYISNVRIDYEAGMRQAVDHLYRFGHREIAVLCEPSAEHLSCSRRRACLQCLRAYGLKPVIEEASATEEGAGEALSRLWQRRSRPTALVATSEWLALGALQAARRLGLEVPRDLSILGLEGRVLCEAVRPTLTTLNVPGEDLGIVAAMALQRLLQSSRPMGTEYRILPNLTVRESTASRFGGRRDSCTAYAPGRLVAKSGAATANLQGGGR